MSEIFSPINAVMSTPISSKLPLNESIGLSPIVNTSRRTCSSCTNTLINSRGSDLVVRIQSKLHFGFVSFGNEKREDLKIQNISNDNVWVEIVSVDSNVFSLKEERSLYLNPKTSGALTFSYRPLKTKTFDQCKIILLVKRDYLKLGPSKFNVTLLGFSGRSEVSPLDLPIGKHTIYELICKRNKSKVEFTINNTGVRSAFVRILLVDNNSKISRSSDLRVFPDEFLVEPSSTNIVKITVSIFSYSIFNQGVMLALYSGEEKQRLRCKEYLNTKKHHGDCNVDGINFANLKITGSCLKDVEKEYLSSEDKRVLKNEINITYVKLISTDDNTDEVAWDSCSATYKIRSQPLRQLDIEEIDDDLDTVIRR